LWLPPSVGAACGGAQAADRQSRIGDRSVGGTPPTPPVVGAISAPVRRVLRPEKSSGPVAVASIHGASSSAIDSMTGGATSSSTTTTPSAASASATSPALLVGGR